MMDICRRLQLPNACALHSRIYKKVLLEQAKLTAVERKAIQQSVKSLHWEAALKPDNCQIPVFQSEMRLYDEVHWVKAVLNEESAAKRVAHTLQKAIPYPLVVVLERGEMLAVQVADKRINQNDDRLRTIENELLTPWFEPEDQLGVAYLDSLAFPQLDRQNLQSHYDAIQARTSQFLSAQLKGIFVVEGPQESRRTLEQLQRIEALEAEISRIRTALKKEEQFNRKVELNIQLKALEAEKKNTIAEL